MENTGHIDLLTVIKQLQAQNNSQAERLEEYAKIVTSRDNEIDLLQKMLSEADAHRSSMDNNLKELMQLRLYIHDLQQQAAASSFMIAGRSQQAGVKVSAEQQLEELKVSYTNLQLQLADLQTQLLDVSNRNLLLQQQASRMAELESKSSNQLMEELPGDEEKPD
ncbi:MAG: hypothetical protein ABIN01_24060 [Ferruginibacter sp.]